jgi:hypothetical protein
MTAIQGNEVTGHWHLLSHFNNYEATNFAAHELAVQEWVDAINANGGLAVVAHPNYRDLPLTLPRMLNVDDYLGIEIYNHACTYYDATGWALDMWDGLLSAGRLVWGFATDDYHSGGDPKEDKGKIVVLADTASEANVKAAIIAGNFYAQVGDDSLLFTDISLSGTTITVETNAAAEISFIGLGGVVLNAETAALSTYEIVGGEGYIRIAAVAAGCSIYSNPVYMEVVETVSEIDALSSLATWSSLKTITVANLPYMTAVRLFDTAGNAIGDATESNGVATITPTDGLFGWLGIYQDDSYTVLLDRYPEGGNGTAKNAIYGGDAYWYEPRKVTYVKFME